MAYTLQRTDEEIDAVLATGKTHFSERTYEEGVDYALSWALGLSERHPYRYGGDEEQEEVEISTSGGAS